MVSANCGMAARNLARAEGTYSPAAPMDSTTLPNLSGLSPAVAAQDRHRVLNVATARSRLVLGLQGPPSLSARAAPAASTSRARLFVPPPSTQWIRSPTIHLMISVEPLGSSAPRFSKRRRAPLRVLALATCAQIDASIYWRVKP